MIPHSSNGSYYQHHRASTISTKNWNIIEVFNWLKLYLKFLIYFIIPISDKIMKGFIINYLTDLYKNFYVAAKRLALDTIVCNQTPGIAETTMVPSFLTYKIQSITVHSS